MELLNPLALLRHSPAEATVWWATLASLLYRQFWGSFHLFPTITSYIHVEGLLPLAALIFNISVRHGGLLWQFYPLLPVITSLLIPFPSWTSQPSYVPPTTQFVQIIPSPFSLSIFSLYLVLIVLSLAALQVFPLNTFPPLPARHKIGFTHAEHIQNTDNGTQTKRIYCIWYPCDTSISAISSAHYFPHHDTQMKLLFESMRHRGITATLFSHLQYVQAETFSDAPLLKKKDGAYPVLIFSHGLYGFPSLYTYICSSLAAYGYIVVCTLDSSLSSSLRC